MTRMIDRVLASSEHLPSLRGAGPGKKWQQKFSGTFVIHARSTPVTSGNRMRRRLGLPLQPVAVECNAGVCDRRRQSNELMCPMRITFMRIT
jgi:hypothetical protein